MNRKTIISVLLILILVVGAVALLKKRKIQLAQAPPAAVLPVVVDTLTLQKSLVTLTLPAMGIVASDLSSTLSTKISGRVLHVFKQEGDIVQKGDQLATIDARDLVAKQEALRSKLAGLDYDIIVQRESHQRTLELLKIGGASLEQSQKEEASIANIGKSKEVLVQNIREVEALKSYATISAPICGTVSKRMVQVGDLASPGKPLFRISACSGQYLNLSLPDNLKPNKILFHGSELALSTKNEASSTGLAQFLSPLPKDAGVVEGQYLNIRVVVYQDNDVLVPVDGLLSIGGDSFVFIREQDKTLKTRVKIVARGSEGVVVRPDLAGRKIILAKPDILLRASSGVPVLEIENKGKQGETLEPQGGQDNG
ncbi:MAG: efflux RND transporter periplasmic adaptor subunit [Desulfobulbaceae bacterium]|jgi:RND family efflux transporter MFP subunit|nr:efflux RND transporter periplasmic adaptor subunit [Desulfobulbaceae bacterium]